MTSSAPPVSAVLITLDAEAHLEEVLGALAWCGEIVVLDSGSTDRTRAIAERHGARFEERPFDGYGAQKNRAVDLASHDWIVAVDADEVLDPEARRALAELDWQALEPTSCGRILRRPFIGSHEVRHGHWVPDRLVRVFNRRHHRWLEHPVHPTITTEGRVFDLPGSLLHYCYADMAEVFRTDYHRMKAAWYRQRGRRASGPLLAARATLVFLRSYLLRRGFLEGRYGVVVAVAGAVNAVLGLAMASEAEERPAEAGGDGRA
jgi:glycosyltransferase involved in cell wall biosynthesis